MNIFPFSGRHHKRVELELLYEEMLEESALPDHWCRGGEIHSMLEQQDFVGIFSPRGQVLCYNVNISLNTKNNSLQALGIQ